MLDNWLEARYVLAMAKKQINVRLPEELIARMDERQNLVGATREQWIERALNWALSQPVTKQKTVTVIEV